MLSFHSALDHQCLTVTWAETVNDEQTTIRNSISMGIAIFSNGILLLQRQPQNTHAHALLYVAHAARALCSM